MTSNVETRVALLTSGRLVCSKAYIEKSLWLQLVNPENSAQRNRLFLPVMAGRLATSAE
jgi:hypothetical protein